MCMTSTDNILILLAGGERGWAVDINLVYRE